MNPVKKFPFIPHSGTDLVKTWVKISAKTRPPTPNGGSSTAQGDSREGGLALLHVFRLGAGSGLPTQVHGDAHEEPALVQEVAGDVDAHQQQEEDHDEDAYDGPRPQAGTGTGSTWKTKARRHKHSRRER